MGKKKNTNDSLEFTPPDVVMKKNNQPSFIVCENSTLKEKTKFDEIRNAIVNLEIGCCVKISNKHAYDLSMFELKRKVCNMVFGYARKNLDKKFKTGQTSKTELEILRTK